MTAYRPDPDDGFTDRQRTRVYRRAAPSEPASIGNTQIMQKEEGLFDGITLPQVIAGAAAAATSVLLASKIGIGGSVIGAAVSSVVTVVSSQLYRKFLTAGARKLKQGKDLLGASHSGAGASSGNRIDKRRRGWSRIRNRQRSKRCKRRVARPRGTREPAGTRHG